MTCHPGCLHHWAQCGGGNAREVPQGLRSQARWSNLGEAFSPKQGCCIRTCRVCSPDSETFTKPLSLTANSWMGLKLDWNIHLCLTFPFLVQDTNAAGTESTWHLEEYNAAKKAEETFSSGSRSTYFHAQPNDHGSPDPEFLPALFRRQMNLLNPDLWPVWK